MAPVIVVTGASRGIGLSIARFLLKRETCVVVVSRSQAPLQQLQSEFPTQVEILTGDLADASVPPKAVALAQSKWGRLDGLVVNHGTLSPVSAVADLDIGAAKAAFDTNFFSAVAMVCSPTTLLPGPFNNRLTDYGGPAGPAPEPRQNHHDLLRGRSQRVPGLGDVRRSQSCN
jgi:NAD(P)-dependent dehydrogenase (short-subunit alcohol dehydrogenase family)